MAAQSNHPHYSVIARELGCGITQVAATVVLLDEGATVPFITRYRKEATGSLDETVITAIRDRIGQLRELDERRTAIIASLEERALLTDELKTRLENAATMTELEDIYLPYRPKRRTRATIAREKGLEPLADLIMAQGTLDPEEAAALFIDAEKGVETVDDALDGARDIIAERVSEDQHAREQIRRLMSEQGKFRTQVASGKEEEGAKFRDYYDWEEPVKSAPSHRVLAMRRGENEGFLTLHVVLDEEMALAALDAWFLTGSGPASEQVRLAVHDGFKRLLLPSLETEIRLLTKERADEEAIRVFAGNLRELLLAPPLGGKRVLAVDPGYRTGCKVCCLDSQGALKTHTTIYPHQSDHQREQASDTIRELCKKYDIEVICVGNGTAGRETETFLRSLELAGNPPIVMVNESGASIYSTSDAARQEFPDLDATVRGTVSIGRRLIDPLAELVKIDPKSIGVGQYQHDVDQSNLRRKLDDVVISCVNSVGVEVNTASAQLLSYVSGLGHALARNIVSYRDTNGPFRTRRDLMAVHRLGEKAFEQAAGFLRIRDGNNPLDASAVHPERYPLVERMAQDLNCSLTELMAKQEMQKRIRLADYVSDVAGMPTLTDIMDELARPGRDPRSKFEVFAFADGVQKIDDLRSGMKLPGIVTNVTAFGVFVDIGVHQDGLVHISQLADRYVKDPNEVVRVHQKVTVTVTAIDIARNRISLSMREKTQI
jgi:protein Tex